MNLGLEGKIALVTGAGSQIGFGKEIALSLAKEGCEAVAVTDINLDDVILTCEAVKAEGVKSIALKADVTNKTEADAMVKKAINEFGDLDILCNVAGALMSQGPFEELDPVIWEKEIALNLFSPMYVCAAVLPGMRKKGKGAIVNISSGSSCKYSIGVNVYSLAKGALDIFTKQLACVEAPNNIRINSIAPGPAPTNFMNIENKQAILDIVKKMNPLGRVTSVKDVADATLFLISDVSIDISGQVLHVSGASVM
jgi:NAD(P)-dependent dehydrogenase (short-subunit alcohol dehydrogenase family)